MGDMEKALQHVLTRNPDLCADGFGGKVGDEAPSVGQFTRAVAWLSLMPRRQALNRDFDSYGIKHGAERWADGYVSNGALIAAALHLGFIVEPTGRNALVNVAARSKWPIKAEG